MQRGELVYAEHVARYGFAAQFVRGLRVLDVACGTGYGGEMLLSAGAKSVVAVDYAIDSLRYALKNRISASQALVVGDAESLPFEDASFDAVTSFETIEHLPDPLGFLRELRRVLVADGVLILSTPNRLTSDGTNPFHLREFAAEELLALLKQQFQNVRLFPQSNWIASLVGTPSSQTWRTVGAPGGESDDAARSEYLVTVSANGRLPDLRSVAAPFDKMADQLGPLKAAISWSQADDASWQEAAERFRSLVIDLQGRPAEPPPEAQEPPAKSMAGRALGLLAPAGSTRGNVHSSIVRGVQMVRTTGILPFLRHLVKVRQWLPRTIHGDVLEPFSARTDPEPGFDERDLLRSARDELNQRYASWLGGFREEAPPKTRIEFGVVIVGGASEALTRSIRSQRYPRREELDGWPGSVLQGKFSHLIFVKTGGVLAPSATAEFARSFALDEEIDFVFPDEDHRGPDGTRVDPVLKPGWSPDLLLSSDYISNIFACTRQLYEDTVAAQPPLSSVYDLALRLTERAQKVHHLALPLYSRLSTHEGVSAEEPAEAGAALQDATGRRGLDATVEATTKPGIFRVRRRLSSTPLVSVVLPTRDKPGLLTRCLASLD